jgi:iron(III) transport system substrate-binding protein
VTLAFGRSAARDSACCARGTQNGDAEAMKKITLSRRTVLKGSSALAASTIFAAPLRAQPPEPAAITPALIEAAKKEGKLAFYTAMDLAFAQQLAKAFEAKFSGIAVRVERSGAERVFTRIGQEYAANIHAVDVVNTSDQAHCIVWIRSGWLAPYLPEEVAKHFDKAYYDPDGMHVTSRILVSPLGYNTSLVKKEDAPKSFKDLLDPKWAGKLVKAHPAYSGTIMNATFQIARDLGWDYFEKLAKQRVMQVQSATDTPKKISLGERAVMVDGAGYLVIRYKEDGQPVEIIYPEEGTPLATGPSAVFKAAPNPNAARLFQNWMHSREAQQMFVDVARQYSAHGQTVEKPGVRPLSQIKLMKEDPAGVERDAEAIKTRYAQIFRV